LDDLRSHTRAINWETWRQREREPSTRRFGWKGVFLAIPGAVIFS